MSSPAVRVAQSGRFNDVALKMCDRLKFSPVDLVRKGVSWALKDRMGSDKDRILEVVFTLRQDKVFRVITSYAIRDIRGNERANFLARV